MFYRVKLPLPDNPIEIFSDGNDDYTYILKELYPETCMNYGQAIKIKEGGRLVRKEKRVIYGSPDIDDIDTVYVESLNSILREGVGRLVRKTKCISKKKRILCNALELIEFHWNFMDPLPIGDTPAVIEGLTNHTWGWEDFLMYHFAV
jgi:hypothetical protein